MSARLWERHSGRVNQKLKRLVTSGGGCTSQSTSFCGNSAAGTKVVLRIAEKQTSSLTAQDWGSVQRARQAPQTGPSQTREPRRGGRGGQNPSKLPRKQLPSWTPQADTPAKRATCECWGEWSALGLWSGSPETALSGYDN